MLSKVIFFTAFLALASIAHGKVYTKCEVAKALKAQGVPSDQIATWVCIAHAESDFNTKAINTNTWDYGIFQISSIYWCKKGDSPGNGCGISCNSLLGDDIKEDITCIRKVYKETEAIGQKPGFKAWTTYDKCKGDVSQWTKGC